MPSKDGPPQTPEAPAPPLTEDQVVPGYFEAMRIPVLRGRLLQESDLTPGAPPVVVINEEMARRFWPGQDPIGRRFKSGIDPGAKMNWKTVVGVVSDIEATTPSTKRRFPTCSSLASYWRFMDVTSGRP